jgi:hypothetical protein
VNSNAWERTSLLLGCADAEIESCAQTWDGAERRDRKEAMAMVTYALGRRSDSLYEEGRLGFRDEELGLR